MVILFRSIFIWVFGILFTGIVGSIAVIFSLFKAERVVHRIAIFWGKTLAYLSGIEIEVNHPENLVRDETIIIVANHQSMFDILVFYSFLDIQFRWLAKASLFKIPVFGQAMRGAGYIPVEREDRKKAQESLFEAAEQVKKGTSLILFPEGTRGHPDGSLLPFKKGAFVLAKMAGVTIQPITIWGANKAIPKQEGKWIQRIYPTLVQVFIHSPIPKEKVQAMSVEELSETTRKIIEEPFPKLRLRHEVEDELKTW